MKDIWQIIGKDPPDPQKLTADFWRQLQKEVEDELKIIMFVIFAASFEGYGKTNTENEAAAVGFAVARATSVSQSFATNSERDWRSVVRDWSAAKGEMPVRDLDGRIKTIFSPGRMDGMAVTEVTNTHTEAGEIAARNGGELSENDTWFTSERSNVCPICKPLHNKPRSVWSRVAPTGPPAHPRCNCWIEYEGEKK